MAVNATYTVETISRPLFLASEPFTGMRDGYVYQQGPLGSGGYLMAPCDAGATQSLTASGTGLVAECAQATSVAIFCSTDTADA